MATHVRPLATIPLPSLARLGLSTEMGDKRELDGTIRLRSPTPDADMEEGGDQPRENDGGGGPPMESEPAAEELSERKKKEAAEKRREAEQKAEAGPSGGGRKGRKQSKPPQRNVPREMVPMTAADRQITRKAEDRLDFEKLREEARLAERKVGTFTPADLYRDMRIQSELCLLVSTETRKSEDSRALAPMVYDEELDDWLPPVAVDDVDVVLPYDAWTGLQLDDPAAPKNDEQNKLTMYFWVDADENVDVAKDSADVTSVEGVRIDPGRYRAYKEYMQDIEENKSNDAKKQWDEEEKNRRMKDRERVRDAIIHRRNKAIARYKENQKQRHLREIKGANAETWAKEAESRSAEWELETAKDAQAARMLADARQDYFAGEATDDEPDWKPTEQEWENKRRELMERIKEETQDLVFPPPLDPTYDPPILANSELVRQTGSRIGTFNMGQPPPFQGQVPDESYRQYLRNHLYKFGMNADFWYTKSEHPHPPKGMVAFKYNAMLLQERKLSSTPVATSGVFLRRCAVDKSVVDREERTGRPLTHEGHTSQTCPNWAKYIRATRYRTEVARLWYKLFLNQPPEILSRMMAEAGVTDPDAGTGDFGKMKKAVSGRRKAVLAVIEYGDKGTLRLPSILPAYKPKSAGDQSSNIVYEIVNQTKFDKELRSDEPNVPEVQERGNYTWPIQKIDKTTTWLRFVDRLQDRNIFTLALLEALFQEDLGKTWDWWPGAIPENVKRLFLNDNQPLSEFDEGYAYLEMELVFESLIESIPLWAQSFLSVELVDDSWTDTDNSMVEVLSKEKQSLRQRMEAASAKLKAKLGIIDIKQQELTQPNLSQLMRQRKQAELVVHFEDKVKLSLEYNSALVGMNKLVRDHIFASFEWNAYAVNTQERRDVADSTQNSGVRTSWAKTQLHRCCYEVDTTPVKGETPPPPDHVPIKYFIGPERTSGKTVKVGIRGFDRKVLVPGEEGLELWYGHWYIEKVLGFGVGRVGQLVTLQNMFKYLRSPVSPHYVQTQGQYGIIEAVKTVEGGWLPQVYRVNVLGYIMDDVYDRDETQGLIDKNGHPIVEVTGEHIWPLQWGVRFRYGDVVAPRIDDMPEKDQKMIRDDRYAMTQYYWLAPKEFTDVGLLDKAREIGGGEGSSAFLTASNRGNVQLTEWDPKYDIIMRNDVAYRNTKSFIFHAPNEKPEGKMRRPPKRDQPALQFPDTMQTLYNRIMDNDERGGATFVDDPRGYTATGRVLKQYGTRVKSSGVAYYSMDEFQEGPSEIQGGPKGKATNTSVLTDAERQKLREGAGPSKGVEQDEDLKQALKDARAKGMPMGEKA